MALRADNQSSEPIPEVSAEVKAMKHWRNKHMERLREKFFEESDEAFEKFCKKEYKRK